MMREERLWRITQQITKERKVYCDQLAKEFGLTLASIRLDLAELERRGVAKRVYGGAVLTEPETPPSKDNSSPLYLIETQFAERFQNQRAEKEAIGRAAANLIHNGETIMIDGGTTTYQVCRNLADKRNLSIISDAFYNVWQELVSRSNLQIFLTGGFLRAESLSLVGEVAENMLHSFRAVKSILGIDGISLENGFTTLNFLEAGVKKRMIENTQELIIVADHTKFGKICPIPVAPIQRASKIVTDSGTSPDIIARLEKQGVEVIVANGVISQTLPKQSSAEGTALPTDPTFLSQLG
jgi:DeoR/GlpR family transcriptional regulator of sugar metabolism